MNILLDPRIFNFIIMGLYALKEARIRIRKQLENELAEEKWDRQLRRSLPLGIRD